MTGTLYAAALASAAIALLPATAAAGTLPFTATQTNFSPPGDPAGRCAPAVTVNFINSGPYFMTGSSNFGAFEANGSQCTAFPNIYGGEGSLTFAIGKLFVTWVGTITPLGPTSFRPDQTFTIIGGTGFFADATGGWTQTGVVFRNPDGTTNGDVTLNGFITTPAPSMLALLGLSLGGLAAVRRRMARPR